MPSIPPERLFFYDFCRVGVYYTKVRPEGSNTRRVQHPKGLTSEGFVDTEAKCPHCFAWLKRQHSLCFEAGTIQ